MGFGVRALALAGKNLGTEEVVLWKVERPRQWRKEI